MRRNIPKIFTFLLFAFLISCYSSSHISSKDEAFTAENLAKIRPGMNSEKIIELFGNPVSTQLTTLDKKLKDHIQLYSGIMTGIIQIEEYSFLLKEGNVNLSLIHGTELNKIFYFINLYML